MIKIQTLFILALTATITISCTDHGSQRTTITTEQNENTVHTTIENKNDRLSIFFDNSKNTATIQLNDGEQIELKSQRPASGMWYANDKYELRGKGETFDLYKEGELVFTNK